VPEKYQRLEPGTRKHESLFREYRQPCGWQEDRARPQPTKLGAKGARPFPHLILSPIGYETPLLRRLARTYGPRNSPAAPESGWPAASDSGTRQNS
jgi:hypothetical protein